MQTSIRVARIAGVFAILAAAPAWAQIEIQEPWARPTAPGAKVAAGYMVVNNQSGTADRLIGASSPSAARVETHVTVKDGDVFRMRAVKGYDLPPQGRFELKPGGAHLMFIEPRQPFRPGDRIPVTLKFERAGEVTAQFEVRQPGAGHHGKAPAHKH